MSESRIPRQGKFYSEKIAIAKRTLNRLASGGGKGFWSAAPWVFLVIGIAVLAIAHLAVSSIELPGWHGFLISVGSLLLSAGVFSILLKSVQYLDIFRDELLKIFDTPAFESVLRRVIWSDDTHDDKLLATCKDLVSKYLITKPKQLRAPLIASLVKLLERANCASYNRHFRRTIRITAFDPNLRVIKLEDEVFIELIPKTPDESIRYIAKATRPTPGSPQSTETIGSLVVNGQDYSDKIQYGDQSVGYDFILVGNGSYSIDRRYEKQFRLPDDPYIHLRLTRHTLNLRLKVENMVADKIGAVLTPSGFDPDAPETKWTVVEKELVRGVRNVTIEMSKETLTFPNEGYMLVVYEK